LNAKNSTNVTRLNKKNNSPSLIPLRGIFRNEAQPAKAWVTLSARKDKDALVGEGGDTVIQSSPSSPLLEPIKLPDGLSLS
jgi:hypothetical protein